jgi:hypothetical protein
MFLIQSLKCQPFGLVRQSILVKILITYLSMSTFNIVFPSTSWFSYQANFFPWSFATKVVLDCVCLQKAKAVSLHAMEALGWRGGNSFYSFLTSALDGMSGQCHST